MTEFIWNGVGLTTPDTWEPAAIERDGLFLECGGQPACELKWRTVHGSFSFAKHIKRLTKGHKAVELHAVPEAETPEAWRTSLAALARSGIRHESFIWRTPAHRGIGAALHVPATGLAVLVQFFISSAESETVAADTLGSLRDYTGGKTVPFAMFGLKGRVPSDFVLHTFSFQPGQYTIQYWRAKTTRQTRGLPTGKGPGTALHFERFAPASVILKGTTLADWVAVTLAHGPGNALPMTGDATRVRWDGPTKTSLLRRVLRRAVHSRGAAWTTDTGNAILAVTASGMVPMDNDNFNRTSEHYGIV